MQYKSATQGTMTSVTTADNKKTKTDNSVN